MKQDVKPSAINDEAKKPAIKLSAIDDDAMITAEAVCSALGMSRVALWRNIRKGEVIAPTRVIASKRFWHAGSFKAWLRGDDAYIKGTKRNRAA